MIPGGLTSVVIEGMEPVQLFPTDMQLPAMSLKWTALEPRTTLQSMLMVNEAQSFDKFREALRSWGGPAEGIVCADTQGNIGYVLPGPMPIRGAASRVAHPTLGPDWPGQFTLDREVMRRLRRRRV